MIVTGRVVPSFGGAISIRSLYLPMRVPPARVSLAATSIVRGSPLIGTLKCAASSVSHESALFSRSGKAEARTSGFSNTSGSWNAARIRDSRTRSSSHRRNFSG
jgi:hypothetical protein